MQRLIVVPQLTLSPCGFPEEMHCLFMVPYPHDVAIVYSSGLKQQCPRGREHMHQ